MDALEAERRVWMVECFLLSPSAQDNGIACVIRAWNVTWRKYFRSHILKTMEDILRYLRYDPGPTVPETLLALLDFDDVFNRPHEQGDMEGIVSTRTIWKALCQLGSTVERFGLGSRR